MSDLEHSHWDRYHTRIIPEKYIISGARKIIPEKLQLICINDGVIFHEVDVTYHEK